MKWLLCFLCFTTITVFSQTNKESLIEKLKKTEEKLGRSTPGLNHKSLQLPPSVNSKKPGRTSPGSLPNAETGLNYKRLQWPSIINSNQQSIVIALPQDHMPCIVPNMSLFRVMPNAGNRSIIQKPVDPDIYLQRPKS